MANATENLTPSIQRLEEALATYLDATQDDYYKATYLQSDDNSDAAVSVASGTEGRIMGRCAASYSYSNTLLQHRVLNYDISACIRKDLEVAGSPAAATHMGYPVYATDDQTVTITYAAGAKLVGFLWVLHGDVVFCDIGWLNNMCIGLVGGVDIDAPLFTLPADELTTAFHYQWTAKEACVVDNIEFFNNIALSGSTDFTVTVKKNAAGADLATLQISGATKIAQNYVNDVTPGTAIVCEKGDTIDIYTATVGAAATAGIITVRVEGYWTAR